MSPPHVFTIWWIWPTSGWDLLASLGHPCTFQRVSHLGSVTAWHSSSGRQPNFEALNRGRHLYLAGGHHDGHWPTFLVFIIKSCAVFLPFTVNCHWTNKTDDHDADKSDGRQRTCRENFQCFELSQMKLSHRVSTLNNEQVLQVWTHLLLITSPLIILPARPHTNIITTTAVTYSSCRQTVLYHWPHQRQLHIQQSYQIHYKIYKLTLYLIQ